MIDKQEKINRAIAEVYISVMKDVILENQRNITRTKTITNKIRLIWALFYIKYLSHFILILSVIALLLGIPIIATEKGPSFQILTSLGGFVGGVFTVIAVVLAAKEYYFFNAYKGIKDYRAFIVSKIRPISNMIIDDYVILKEYLTDYLADEHNINNNDKDEITKELLEMSHKYHNLVIDISSEFNDLSYHNDFLRLKSKGDFYFLELNLHHFSYAIQNVYLHYASFANVEVDRNNDFICDFLVEKADHKPQSLMRLLTVLKKIDEDRIFN